MSRLTASIIPVVLLAACATLEGPDSSNVSAYCTEQNGYRLGSWSKAYYGGCPKESEGAFLAGLERGRAIRPNPPQAMPYFDRMQQTERELLASNSEPDRQRLRDRLREHEFWAIHIVNSPGTYSVDN
jgi:hypothetical protein